eukprot:TRINITY_DN43335_c0_g1_i1.p1 TRINITY_DN43335_c0_g1~~TRINITY_DN43335_c0_g1_i1.p1  ORF type:complete len:384 (+),score=97.76 TRINITY_DN43335_c0_g1_i1:67-1152(+)
MAAAGDAGEHDLGMDAAGENAECPICFDALSTRPLSAFFAADGKRSCRHYFHLDCVADLPTKVCPMCRTAYETAGKVPDPRVDPAGWLRVVDSDGSGYLTLPQAQEVLRCMLDVDEVACDKAVAGKWAEWTGGPDGRLGPNELPRALAFMGEHIPGRVKRDPPRLGRDHASKMAWFEFWDEAGVGRLDKGQVARALIKTIKSREPTVEVKAKVRYVGGGRMQGPQQWPGGSLNPGDIGEVRRLLRQLSQTNAEYVCSFPSAPEVVLQTKDLEVVEGARDAVDMQRARKAVGAAWRLFDRDGDGMVSKQDFVQTGGLADCVLGTQEVAQVFTNLQDGIREFKQTNFTEAAKKTWAGFFGTRR